MLELVKSIHKPVLRMTDKNMIFYDMVREKLEEVCGRVASGHFNEKARQTQPIRPNFPQFAHNEIGPPISSRAFHPFRPAAGQLI